MTAARGGAAVTVCLAEVTSERVDWLWPSRLPLGKIVILDGDPSVGKSTVSVDCAARVSIGRSWPDGAPNRVGAVLLLSAEDGLADTIRPRLEAAGGDASRVHALTEIRYRDDEGKTRTRQVTLSDVAEIERAVIDHDALLVVVDVLMAYLPRGVDSHRDQDVRSVLAGLAAMAERTRCCVLLLRHLNKSSGGSPMYRGGGSIGIIGAARVALLAAIDPSDEGGRVLAGVKSNLSELPEALGYRLVESPAHGCAKVEWLGITQRSAAELLAVPGTEARNERDDAVAFIRQYLAECGGEAPSRDVLDAGRDAGFAPRTLQDARTRADGLTATRRGFGPGGVWWWTADTPIDPIDARSDQPAPIAAMEVDQVVDARPCPEYGEPVLP
jgi:hypothetical protein